MEDESARTDSQPCHVQLWAELDRLDEAVAEMELLYHSLAGTRSTDRDVATDEMTSLTFAAVLAGATGRVAAVRITIVGLQKAIAKLCLHGCVLSPGRAVGVNDVHANSS